MAHGAADGIAGSRTALIDALTRGDVAARIDRPRPMGTGAGVSVWPLALLTEPIRPGRAGQATGETIRLRVRYLLTAADPARLPEELDKALRAVNGHDGLLLVPEHMPADVWQALGVPPQAAVLVDVPVVLAPAHDAPAPRRVLAPLRVEPVSLRTLRGQVVGPEGVPLSGVRVEAAGTGRSAYTDVRGGFVLSGMPDDVAARLVLFVRDRHLTADVDTSSTEPVLIHCDLT